MTNRKEFIALTRDRHVKRPLKELNMDERELLIEAMNAIFEHGFNVFKWRSEDEESEEQAIDAVNAFLAAIGYKGIEVDEW